MKLWGSNREIAKLDSVSIISKSGTMDVETAKEKLNGEQNHVLLCWNVSAIAAVSVPLFGFVLNHLINVLSGKGSTWWNNVKNRRRPEIVALDIVYVWGLVLFVAMVVWGNRVIGDCHSKNLRTLIGGLFVFTNLSLLCAILSAGLAIASEARLRDIFMEQFSSVIILSFSFWALFGIVFTWILFRLKMRSKVMFSSDYMRYENDIVA